MREDGLYAEALTDWTMAQDGASALLLNFTNIDSQAHGRGASASGSLKLM